MGAYLKHYGTQNVLMRLVAEWRANLDKKTIGAVLLDLSKVFDCIPLDLLIAKLNVYGFDWEALKLIYSYLQGRKQCVRINIYSNFIKLLSGVPQVPILGALIFNIFLNDLLFITKASLHEYAGYNTLSASSIDVASLMELLVNLLIKNSLLFGRKKFFLKTLMQ